MLQNARRGRALAKPGASRYSLLGGQGTVCGVWLSERVCGWSWKTVSRAEWNARCGGGLPSCCLSVVARNQQVIGE